MGKGVGTHSRCTVKYLQQKMDFAVEFQMYSSEHGLGILIMLYVFVTAVKTCQDRLQIQRA